MGRRRELIVLLLIGVLVVAGLWATLIRPKGNQAAAAHADEQAAVDQAASLRGQIRALEATRADADGLRARAREARDLFPGKPALPDLTNALQKIADQSGVDLVGIQPSAPTASPTTPELVMLATTVTVGGGYFEIEDFLARMENLVKSPDPATRIPPRSVLVRSVNVAGSGASGAGTGATGAAAPTATAGAGSLTATVSLAVFQHAKTQTPAAAAAGGAAAAAAPATTTTTPPASTAPASATTRPPAYVPAQGRR
jgi:hypothetical protein